MKQDLKIYLFDKVPDDHPENILEPTGTENGNSNQLVHELLDRCIEKEICSGYFLVFFLVQGRRKWVGYKSTGMHERDTTLLLKISSLLKDGLGQMFSTQSGLKIQARAYFKTDYMHGKQMTRNISF